MNPLVSTLQEANTALIEDGRLDSVEQFFTQDYVAHATDFDMEGGHEAIRKYVGMLRGAFPDVRVEVEVLLEGPDRVAWQRTLRATQEGAFQGFPASRSKIVWRDMITSRFRDGLIAEEWVVTDLAERLLRAKKR